MTETARRGRERFDLQDQLAEGERCVARPVRKPMTALWEDVRDAEVWRDVFKQDGKSFLSVNVGYPTELPAFSLCRELLDPTNSELVRTQIARAYQELAAGLHRLANKCLLRAEELVPTAAFEVPIEVLAINLMNEIMERAKKEGGGALSIAQGQLATHLRLHGWKPPE